MSLANFVPVLPSSCFSCSEHATNAMCKFTTEIGFKGLQNPDEVGAAAVDYLRVAGHLVFAYFWARMAKVALEKQASGDKFYRAKMRDRTVPIGQSIASAISS